MELNSILPLGDRVLIKTPKQEKNKQKTSSGILIPDSATAEESKTCTVIAVGPGLYTQNGVSIPMTVAVGDEVILPSFNQSQKIKVNGEEYDLVRESDLIAVLKKS
jgi:chaperonin GroES